MLSLLLLDVAKTEIRCVKILQFNPQNELWRLSCGTCSLPVFWNGIKSNGSRNMVCGNITTSWTSMSRGMVYLFSKTSVSFSFVFSNIWLCWHACILASSTYSNNDTKMLHRLWKCSTEALLRLKTASFLLGLDLIIFKFMHHMSANFCTDLYISMLHQITLELPVTESKSEELHRLIGNVVTRSWPVNIIFVAGSIITEKNYPLTYQDSTGHELLLSFTN